MQGRSALRVAVASIWIGALVATAAPGAGPAASASTLAAARTRHARSAPVRPLPPSVEAAVMGIAGTTVRREGHLRVDRVRVPASIRGAGVPASVYRVRVAGLYPPRALRYVVTAGGVPVAYGVPSGALTALVAVTADPAVVTDRIRIRYGGRTVRAGVDGDDDGDVGSRHARAPGAMGPLAVTRREFDLGDEVFQPSDLDGKVELAGDVHYPKHLPGGPYPLVLFLHGNHSSCYQGVRASYRWPCPDGWSPLPNDEGYDYIAERLASYGFIVASVSGNGVNVLGNQVGDTGMRQRGELLERHLELWRDWSTVGGAPFGSRFVGKVDLDRTGTMGHSRGGEGAIWQVIVDRERADPFGIDAVLPLAPVDFTRATVNDVPMAVMLPYCDGDVSDLQGVHFFDDARYRQDGDPTPKHVVTVMGANHNSFNTVWTPSGGYPGSFDDGTHPCRGRLRAAEQRRVGAAYIVSFFRRYVGGGLGQDPIWTGERDARGIAPAHVLTTYLAPDLASRRMDVDRFTEVGSLSEGHLGGKVTAGHLSRYRWCPDTFAHPCVGGAFSFQDIHLEGLARGVLGWADRTGWLRFRLPEGTGDVRGFDAIGFRAELDPGAAANAGLDRQDLVLRLIDDDGMHADVRASSVGGEALAFPSKVRSGVGHVIMQQVRFPLDAFDGVDLGSVRFVQLRFSRTRAGVIHLADLAFTAGAS